MTSRSAAAVLLLRNLANDIESGELGVSSLVNAALIEDLGSSDPYIHIPVRTKLEVITFKNPLFKQED